MNKVAMIMAGGTGTRFWPLSRTSRPKQVLSIGDQPVMLKSTLERLRPVYSPDQTYVITSRKHQKRVAEVCSSLPKDHVIGEPQGRDTAPCAGLGGVLVSEWHDPDTVIGVFPADHRIEPEAAFHNDVTRASQVCAEWGGITTLGIKPTFASTGYGYIEFQRDRARELDNKPVYPVRRFTEKPQREQAEQFLSRGNYLWNSGMFFWPASHILEEIDQHMPSLYRGLMKIRDELRAGTDLSSALSHHYGQLPATSVDYGIMEETETVWTVPATFEWSDLGTWDALESVHEADAQGNISIGDVHSIDSSENILMSADSAPVIGTVGLNNLIVVATEDAVLVCRKDRAEDVKTLVNHLQQEGREEVL